MKKNTKEWIHYPIVWSLVWTGLVLFMKYVPSEIYDFKYMTKVFLVGLVIFTISDKLVHKYYLKEK